MDMISYAKAMQAIEQSQNAVNIVSNFPNGFHYKGKVDSSEDLPTDASIGDVYSVANKGNREYAWNGEEWGELSANTPYMVRYGETVDAEDLINRFNNGQTVIVYRDSNVGETTETHLQYFMSRYTNNLLWFESCFATPADDKIQFAMVWLDRSTNVWNKEVIRTYKDSYIDSMAAGAFFVQKGTTTWNELLQAYNSNQAILCNVSGQIYTLTSFVNNTATFTKNTFFFDSVSMLQMTYFTATKLGDNGIKYSDNQYSYIETTRYKGEPGSAVSTINSKVNVINDETADMARAYPNVKAVKDYVDNLRLWVGDIDEIEVEEKICRIYVNEYYSRKECYWTEADIVYLTFEGGLWVDKAIELVILWKTGANPRLTAWGDVDPNIKIMGHNLDQDGNFLPNTTYKINIYSNKNSNDVYIYAD